MKDDTHLYIEQQAVEDDLYTVLQKKTLEELQRLSGKVWTDYNTHDPGVTIADITNYALTELNYKFGFSLQDYLTGEKDVFSPEKYGLFLPEAVYPTTPVTANDYRELLYAEFPTLENIRVDCNKQTGSYDIYVERSPFDESKDIVEQIRKCFHAHRNLCENLNEVRLYETMPLSFHSEFEIETGEDATELLAEMYWNIMQYLSGFVRIEQPEMRFFSDIPSEEWLEGATGETRVTIPNLRNTEHELYKLLVRLEGVKAFKTCYLLDENGDIITDFRKGYQVVIPKQAKDFHVKITIGKTVVFVDEERFSEELQALYFSRSTSRFTQNESRQNKNDASFCRFVPTGVYRNMYVNRPVARDLPRCYMTDVKRLSTSASVAEKSRVNRLAVYLALFDLILQRGLTELDELKNLFSIVESSSTTLSEMRILCRGEKPSKTNDRYRDVFTVKSQYLDFLERLYGVENTSVWLLNNCYYGETENHLLSRRMEFLRNVPTLTKNRSASRNIYEKPSTRNVPTIKAYLSYLLGLNIDEATPVGNILPSHNLVLMGDKQEYKPFRDWMNSMLIDESRMGTANIENIEMIAASRGMDETWIKSGKEERAKRYEELRRELPVFNINMISGGLFRGGIDLDNYKLVNLGHGEYLLAFWNDEDGVWVNLGRMNDRERLMELARILRYYLQELNRLCEVVYVLEHNLLYVPEYFVVSFIFPDWTARFKSIRFRNSCKQQIKSLLPVHLKARMYWLSVQQMQHFEENYRKWCESLPKGGAKAYSDELLKILENAQMKEDV